MSYEENDWSEATPISSRNKLLKIESGIKEAHDALDRETEAGKSLTRAETAAAQRDILGLGNVNNTSDIDKPISTAQSQALASKADLVGGKVPSSQLPSYVDDVLEYVNLAAFPVAGETGKIYVATGTGLTYRWSGSAYVEISQSLALGETAQTAYRGDRGAELYALKGYIPSASEKTALTAGYAHLAKLAAAEAYSALWSYDVAAKMPPALLREIVEAASCGAATVKVDDLGYPSMMYIISGPKMCGHLHADFGAATDVFPAFNVAGATKTELLIGMYDATEYNSGAGARAVVWPGLFATGSKTFDQAKALCTAKGAGWHLMSIWENALVEWLSTKRGTEPRGNTYYGRTHESGYEFDETAVRYDGLAPGNTSGTAKHRNGACPTKWSHNHERWGIYDMVGNLWRWVDQMKIIGGEVFLTDDNNYGLTETSWPTTGAFFDGAGKLWGSAHVGAYTGAVPHVSQAMDASYDALSIDIRRKLLRSGVTTKLAQASAVPFSPKGYLWVDAPASEERLPFVGGGWHNGSLAGLAALYLGNPRSAVSDGIGFRPAFLSP